MGMIGSACAEFQELVKGTLTPGKLADLVVLDRDLVTAAPEDLGKARVMLTLLGGRVVYAANDGSRPAGK